MRLIKIKLIGKDKDKAKISFSKEIPYVKYGGSYVRVNVDIDGVSEEELALFPEYLDLDVRNYVYKRKIKDDVDVVKSQYFSIEESNTVGGLMDCVDRLARNVGIQTEYIYRVEGNKNDSGGIDYISQKVIALKFRHMYVAAITCSLESLNEPTDDHLNIKGLEIDKYLSATKVVTLREFSDVDISIVNNKKVVIKSLEQNDDYAVSMIEHFLLSEN